MENEITNASFETEDVLFITLDGRGYLKTASKWATFLAILGFIGTGFIALAGIMFMVISPFMGSIPGLGSSFGIPGLLFGLVYLALATLYFFPAFYLYNFANQTKTALDTNKQEKLDESLKNLKKLFKFYGIMVIVIISAYAIAIPSILIFTFSKGMMH